MATPSQILTALQDQLKNSSDLSYIADEAVILGAREAYDLYPCVAIEKVRTAEEEIDINTLVSIRMAVVVIAIIRVHDPSIQVVGSGTNYGIVDVENHIKKAISEDKTLGGLAIDITIGQAVNDFEEFPVRSVGIELEIFFRQTELTRT